MYRITYLNKQAAVIAVVFNRSVEAADLQLGKKFARRIVEAV